MRSDIFIEWLQYFDNYFRTMDRKIVLFIDNAGSHFNSKILDKNNDTDHSEHELNSDEEVVAESSNSAQNRKRHKKSKQKSQKKKKTRY